MNSTFLPSLMHTNPRAYWLAQARFRAELAVGWRAEGYSGHTARYLEDVTRYLGVARGLPLVRPTLPR